LAAWWTATARRQSCKRLRLSRYSGSHRALRQAASPLTAFLIGPLTQLIFIPFMTTGAGADLIGGWFGTGPDRGIALVFVLTGIVGLGITAYALRSRPYRQLCAHYAGRPELALAC
jgi:DHA3 family multidrug efflux protein-like MFS transporter